MKTLIKVTQIRKLVDWKVLSFQTKRHQVIDFRLVEKKLSRKVIQLDYKPEKNLHFN